MDTVKELKAAIRELRKEMKADGVKRISCFNGGHSPLSYSYNKRMFELETRLEMAKERERK